MKIKDLLKGNTSFGKLLRKITGKETEKARAAVKRCKYSGRIVTLKSEGVSSRYAGVRFAQSALIASVKRNILSNKIARVRRNTRGLPIGMSRADYARRRALPEEQKKVVPHAVATTEAVTEMLKMEKTGTRAHINNESFKRVTVHTANRQLMKRPPKIARRVATAKRSCSAMRSMVAIMERREARFSNA
jgi:hypothetical protein